MTLLIYRGGSVADDDQIMRSETIVDGDRRTLFLSSGFRNPDSGHHSTSLLTLPTGAMGLATPAPDGALLVLVSTGLDNMWADSLLTNYLAVGGKCQTYRESPEQIEPATLGTATAFPIPPRSAEAVVYTRKLGDTAACDGSPTTDPVTVDLAAGEVGYLLVYALDKSTLKALFVRSLG